MTDSVTSGAAQPITNNGSNGASGEITPEQEGQLFEAILTQEAFEQFFEGESEQSRLEEEQRNDPTYG